MSASKLSARLGRIREIKKQTTDQTPEQRHSENSGSQPVLPGWTAQAPYLLEKNHRVRIDSYSETLSPYFALLFPHESASISSLDFSEMSSKFVFFDLETTGLSHGSGTIAFLAGFAYFERPGMLTIRQLLLTDYPGEYALLLEIEEMAKRFPLVVSFNGKCFDSQILVTRFLMNGLKPVFIGFPWIHLDLLFPSRRIWKRRLGSCALSVLEAEVLGLIRDNDLPGSEAPEAWFSFVKEGKPENLLRIADHNKDDCESLARLFFRLDEAISKGEDRAGLIRAMDLRKRKDYGRAQSFLEPLAREGDALAQKLLAVDLEHRLGDFASALALSRLLGDKKRTERLSQKIQNAI